MRHLIILFAIFFLSLIHAQETSQNQWVSIATLPTGTVVPYTFYPFLSDQLPDNTTIAEVELTECTAKLTTAKKLLVAKENNTFTALVKEAGYFAHDIVSVNTALWMIGLLGRINPNLIPLALNNFLFFLGGITEKTLDRLIDVGVVLFIGEQTMTQTAAQYTVEALDCINAKTNEKITSINNQMRALEDAGIAEFRGQSKDTYYLYRSAAVRSTSPGDITPEGFDGTYARFRQRMIDISATGVLQGTPRDVFEEAQEVYRQARAFEIRVNTTRKALEAEVQMQRESAARSYESLRRARKQLDEKCVREINDARYRSLRPPTAPLIKFGEIYDKVRQNEEMVAFLLAEGERLEKDKSAYHYLSRAQQSYTNATMRAREGSVVAEQLLTHVSTANDAITTAYSDTERMVNARIDTLQLSGEKGIQTREELRKSLAEIRKSVEETNLCTGKAMMVTLEALEQLRLLNKSIGTQQWFFEQQPLLNETKAVLNLLEKTIEKGKAEGVSVEEAERFLIVTKPRISQYETKELSAVVKRAYELVNDIKNRAYAYHRPTIEAQRQYLSENIALMNAEQKSIYTKYEYAFHGNTLSQNAFGSYMEIRTQYEKLVRALQTDARGNLKLALIQTQKLICTEPFRLEGKTRYRFEVAYHNPFDASATGVVMKTPVSYPLTDMALVEKSEGVRSATYSDGVVIASLDISPRQRETAVFEGEDRLITVKGGVWRAAVVKNEYDVSMSLSVDAVVPNDLVIEKALDVLPYSVQVVWNGVNHRYDIARTGHGYLLRVKVPVERGKNEGRITYRTEGAYETTQRCENATDGTLQCEITITAEEPYENGTIVLFSRTPPINVGTGVKVRKNGDATELTLETGPMREKERKTFFVSYLPENVTLLMPTVNRSSQYSTIAELQRMWKNKTASEDPFAPLPPLPTGSKQLIAQRERTARALVNVENALRSLGIGEGITVKPVQARIEDAYRIDNGKEFNATLEDIDQQLNAINQTYQALLEKEIRKLEMEQLLFTDMADEIQRTQSTLSAALKTTLKSSVLSAAGTFEEYAPDHATKKTIEKLESFFVEFSAAKREGDATTFIVKRVGDIIEMRRYLASANRTLMGEREKLQLLHARALRELKSAVETFSTFDADTGSALREEKKMLADYLASAQRDYDEGKYASAIAKSVYVITVIEKEKDRLQKQREEQTYSVFQTAAAVGVALVAIGGGYLLFKRQMKEKPPEKRPVKRLTESAQKEEEELF